MLVTLAPFTAGVLDMEVGYVPVPPWCSNQGCNCSSTSEAEGQVPGLTSAGLYFCVTGVCKYYRFWFISSFWDYESTHWSSGARTAVSGMLQSRVLLIQMVSQSIPALAAAFQEILPSQGLARWVSPRGPGFISSTFQCLIRCPIFFLIGSVSSLSF